MDDIETIPYASPKRENDIDDIETISYTSSKRENGIDDRETIPYASPRMENKDEIDKKYIRNQSLKLQLRLKNTLQKQKKIYQK